jgi:hypothetical protein
MSAISNIMLVHPPCVHKISTTVTTLLVHLTLLQYTCTSSIPTLVSIQLQHVHRSHHSTSPLYCPLHLSHTHIISTISIVTPVHLSYVQIISSYTINLSSPVSSPLLCWRTGPSVSSLLVRSSSVHPVFPNVLNVPFTLISSHNSFKYLQSPHPMD